MTARAYTPDTLAAEWQCSAKHVRKLIQSGKLRAFRLGGKLYRIPLEAVEDFQKCQLIGSGDSGDATSSSGEIPQASAEDTGLPQKTRARLIVLRRESTRN